MTRTLDPRDATGQASVELLSFVPLVVIVALAVLTVLVARTAGEQAGEAAEAAAIALVQERNAREAAQEALPRGVRSRATIAIRGGHVRVRVRPRLPLAIPGLAERLAGEADVETGPGRS